MSCEACWISSRARAWLHDTSKRASHSEPQPAQGISSKLHGCNAACMCNTILQLPSKPHVLCGPHMLASCTDTGFWCNSCVLHVGRLCDLVPSRTCCLSIMSWLKGLISPAVVLGPFIQTCAGAQVICNQHSQARAANLSLRTRLRTLIVLALTSSNSKAGALCLPHNFYSCVRQREFRMLLLQWYVRIVSQCNACLQDNCMAPCMAMSNCLSYHLPHHEVLCGASASSVWPRSAVAAHLCSTGVLSPGQAPTLAG